MTSISLRVLVTCVLLAQCLIFPSVGQSLKYDIVKGDKVIGHMTCEKITQNDTVVYTIKSESKIKLLFAFNVSYFMEETTVNDRLIMGKATNSLNGKLQKESYVASDDDQYVVNLDGKLKRFVGKTITYSIPELYYAIPGDRTKIFSQQFADYLEIKKTGDMEYTLHSKDGKNVYTYNSNGICKKVKISRAYATFYFNLN